MKYVSNYFKIPPLFCAISFFGYILLKEYTNNLIIFGILHSILAGILATKLLNTLIILNNNKKYSVVLFFLLMHVIYYGVSSLKYLEPQLLPGLVQNIQNRFFGDVIIFVSIYLSIEIWYRKIRKSNFSFQIISISKVKNLSLAIMFIFIIDIILSIYIYKNTIQIESNSIDVGIIQTQFLLDSILTFLLIVYFGKKKSVFYIFLFLTLVILRGFFYDSRTTLLSPILILIGGLYIMNKINSTFPEKIIKYGSSFIIIFSSIFLLITNRITTNDGTDRLKFLLAYRFDLSDFAMTILLNNNSKIINFKPVIDALILNIPSFIYSNKLEVISYGINYNNLLVNYNLISGLDYQDTYFSMGAMVLGWLGIIFIIPILTYLFCILEVWFNEKKHVGLINKFFLLSIIVIIENEWNKFFSNIRNLIVLFILSFAIKYIFISTKSRKKYPTNLG
ncbi:hypothetical protein G5B47_14225 [Paenibacillus sp. 7124]|uniref:Uncharacterized protein n=1 Tax=Paenibacillus apii TaxID=1850370 RepID=A0A6M1PN49_9BACL|nr:hypothetical protein [Paenibacillus apii]NGM83575.1 hypothetical protein [Paenibacillus apii]